MSNEIKSKEADARSVADICKWLCERGFMRVADEILAAHKRELAEKDAEIAELRECLREAVEWSCGNPDENCGDCVAHGGDTPCKCEKWRKALEAIGLPM